MAKERQSMGQCVLRNPVTGQDQTVSLEIDKNALMASLGYKAMSNKRGRAQLAEGAIIVRVAPAK